MSQVDILNGFFSRADLTEFENKLKTRCQLIKQKLDAATAELQAKRSELFQKEEDAKAATYQMEALLQLVFEIEAERTNKLAAPAQG